LVAVALQATHLVRAGGYEGAAPICRVVTSQDVVALSFDDGPDESYTPRILQLLTRTQAKATFFVIGERASMNPGIVEAEISAGMELANHTWSHADLPDLSLRDTVTEADRTSELLDSLGVPGELFRAPYGEISAPQAHSLTDEGLVLVHWSLPIDTYLHEAQPDFDAVAGDIAAAIRPGDIILAHDARDGGIGRDSTVAVMQRLLPLLREQGVRVVTVSTLLGLGDPIRAQPRWWFWQSGFYCP
jgi:peptidoglycan/xylan/chitin deacetylase (PgdA/CDA1 family)